MTHDLERIAFFIAHHRGVSADVVQEELASQYSSPSQKTHCPQCGAELKWKNLLAHVLRKHPVKIHWNNIPIVREQKKLKKEQREALGPLPEAHFVQGGAPGLGKK